MSFFGITALGPPNIFQSSLVNALGKFHFFSITFLGINVYTDQEFEEAFKRVDRDNSGFITSNEVEELLYETYGYPALEDEIKMFMDEFDANKDGKVSMEEFKAALGRMRAQLDTKKDVGKEYTSYNKMTADRFKHSRMGNELEHKYKVPLTFNQSIGFKVEDPRNKDLIKCERHPINKCPETKYAEEMIKTGFPV